LHLIANDCEKRVAVGAVSGHQGVTERFAGVRVGCAQDPDHRPGRLVLINGNRVACDRVQTGQATVTRRRAEGDGRGAEIDRQSGQGAVHRGVFVGNDDTEASAIVGGCDGGRRVRSGCGALDTRVHAMPLVGQGLCSGRNHAERRELSFVDRLADWWLDNRWRDEDGQRRAGARGAAGRVAHHN